MIDNETIKKARQANLAEYLLSVGVPLIKNGNRYKHKVHDSLVFKKMRIAGTANKKKETLLIILLDIWR